MSTTILWYILGGFILGFLASTLWESLYYRGWRLERYYNEHVLGRNRGGSSSNTQNATQQNREFHGQERRSGETQNPEGNAVQTDRRAERQSTATSTATSTGRATGSPSSTRDVPAGGSTPTQSSGSASRREPVKKNSHQEERDSSRATGIYRSTREQFTASALVSKELASKSADVERSAPDSTGQIGPFSFTSADGKTQLETSTGAQPKASRPAPTSQAQIDRVAPPTSRGKPLPGTSVQPKRIGSASSSPQPRTRTFESSVPLQDNLKNPFTDGISREEIVGVLGSLPLMRNRAPNTEIEAANLSALDAPATEPFTDHIFEQDGDTAALVPSTDPFLTSAEASAMMASQPSSANAADEDTLELTINRLQERSLRAKQPAPPASEPSSASATAAQEALASPSSVAESLQDSNYPDDLTQINGVGFAFQQRLYEADFFTWHQIGESKPEELRAATRAGANTKVEAWCEDAKKLANEHGRANIVFDGPTPSNFRKIKGIGASTIQALLQSEIFTYRDLSRSSIPKLTAIFDKEEINPTAENFQIWIDMAHDLASETKSASKSKKGTSSKKTSAE